MRNADPISFKRVPSGHADPCVGIQQGGETDAAVQSGDARHAIPAASGTAQPIRWVSMWEKHRTIHPRWFWGRHTATRWLMVLFTQALFYGLPWLQWNDRPLVLFDLAERRFYLFAWVFYPQDLIYLTGLLVICAISLFLFTAVAGRVWCGFACPQTVYSQLFMGIERLIEGDRSARLKLDAKPFTRRWWVRRPVKHALWLLVAAWTGFTFVGYFTPVRSLADAGFHGNAGGWELFWVGFYSLATYGNAGFMREQLCRYLCPYARFQGAMFDPDSLIVSYDAARGEPRGTRGRKDNPAGMGLGACVDCGLCVQVCPAGIDIRNGLQYECISCGVCVDACNHVMDKLRYPRGLVRFTSAHGLAQGPGESLFWLRLLRPRVLLYSFFLWLLVSGVGLALVWRPDFRVDVVRDRNALARIADNGAVENVYRLQLMNNSEHALDLTAYAEGLAGVHTVDHAVWHLAPTESRWVVLHVQAADNLQAGSHPMQLRISALREDTTEVDDDAESSDVLPAVKRSLQQRQEKTVFLVPR